jgi:KDO2-lipid IV(A) lauroyltransferase
MPKLVLSGRARRAVAANPAVRRLGWLVEAALLGSFWWACGRLSPERAGRFGAAILGAVGPRLVKARDVRRNLEIAFRERSPAERRRLEVAVWRNLGAIMAEYPHLETICHLEPERLEIAIDPAVDVDRGLVFALPHLANWEVAAAVPAHLGKLMTAIYAPLKNPWLDRRLQGHRAALRCRLVPRDGSALSLLKILKRGGGIGIVADHRDDAGVPIPFFGYDKLTSLSPAWLALKGDAQLVPGKVERLGPARYRVVADRPILPDASLGGPEAQAVGMMRELNARFEAWIRARPEEWFCTKRAWPRRLVIEKPAETALAA